MDRIFALRKDIDTEVEQIDFIEVAKECGIVSKGAAWVAFSLQSVFAEKLTTPFVERSATSAS
jgi:hypothetical protein